MKANNVTKITAIRSALVIPSTLPNKAASKPRVKVLNLLIMAIPRAKLAVVIIHMAASAPIVFFLVAKLISTADMNPHTLAPMKKLIDIRDETTAPPKMA